MTTVTGVRATVRGGSSTPSATSAARTNAPSASSPSGEASAARRPRRAAGRAQQVLGMALLAGRGQRVEPHEREVDERRIGADEVDGHSANASARPGSRSQYSAKISRAVFTDGTSGCKAKALIACARE